MAGNPEAAAAELLKYDNEAEIEIKKQVVHVCVVEGCGKTGNASRWGREHERERESGEAGGREFFFVGVRVCECLSVLCVCVCLCCVCVCVRVIERYTESETGTGKSTQRHIGSKR